MKKEQGLKIEVATFRVTVVAVMLSLLCTCGASNFDPLILIPGNGGNQLEARLTNQYKPSTFICESWYPLIKKKNGWFRLWFDSSVILAPFTQCFAERMTLHYHQELDDYFNTPGSLTLVPPTPFLISSKYIHPFLLTHLVVGLFSPLQIKLDICIATTSTCLKQRAFPQIKSYLTGKHCYI